MEQVDAEGGTRPKARGILRKLSATMGEGHTLESWSALDSPQLALAGFLKCPSERGNGKSMVMSTGVRFGLVLLKTAGTGSDGFYKVLFHVQGPSILPKG